MKTLLLSFSVQEDSFPLGLAYLKGYVEKATGFPVETRDFQFGNRFSQATNQTLAQKAISYIILKKPDIVGFSAYIWNIQVIRTIARGVRALRPDIRLVLGGPEADEKSLDDFDFIIVREGEVALAQLLEHLAGRRDLASVRNLVTRRNGRVLRNAEAVLETLDDLPFPYRLPHKRDFDVVKIETSRGCPFTCAYCHYSRVPTREFTMPYLEANIPFLFEHYTFSNLTLLDANFNLDKVRMKGILDLIQKHQRGPLRVSFEMKPEFIDEEMIAFLSKYNFLIAAELGLQSTDPEVLKQSKRPYKIDAIQKGLRLLDASKIRYKIDLMYGLPGDTFWKFLNSASFVMTHARRQAQVVAHHHMLLNNTVHGGEPILRADARDSSMVVKTGTQDTLDFYKTRLFLSALNESLKKGRTKQTG